ncbi:hypothetical protein [Sphingobium sp. D43FB]|uniref:hypothetical protein n=1 Tax=Sphingobium sp. D43FB TaxID=2017595 RepID=UPI0011432DB8|nr:hypothetical protein [Sphingobium sp. D43FB]
MRNAVLALSIVCLLSSCGDRPDEEDQAGQPTSPYADLGKQATWNDAGKEAIKAKLRDPTSAEFQDVKFHLAFGKTPVSCGKVNAKNGFGGYGGYERFIAAGDVITVLESEMAPGEMDKTWEQLCTP